MDVVRVGVIGGGLVAQAVHLPVIELLDQRYSIVALADPSVAVRQALAERYRIARTYADWRDLVEDERVEAVIVASPNATHADIVLASLAHGLHVLVEKPLCLSPTDADAIVSASAQAGRVVQVGYMKRYDQAFRAMAASLGSSSDPVRYAEATTYDPGLPRQFPSGEIVLAADVPERALRALAEDEERQVCDAVGAVDRRLVKIFGDVYLGALIHDLDLVMGLLRPRGLGATALHSRISDGPTVHGTFGLSNGATFSITWMLLDGQRSFLERAAIYTTDALHAIEFSAPYSPSRVHGARYRRVEADEDQRETTVLSRKNEYVTELEHFHDCVVSGSPCQTPCGEGAEDVRLLTELFAVRG